MLLLRCHFGFNIWTMKNDTAKWNFLESRRILHIFRQSFYYVSPPTILQVFWQAFIALQQRGSCCVFTTTLSKNTWFWLHDESPSTIEKEFSPQNLIDFFQKMAVSFIVLIDALKFQGDSALDSWLKHLLIGKYECIVYVCEFSITIRIYLL